MKYLHIPSTQAVGLGFARPPFRGCGLETLISTVLEALCQHAFGALSVHRV